METKAIEISKQACASKQKPQDTQIQFLFSNQSKQINHSADCLQISLASNAEAMHSLVLIVAQIILFYGHWYFVSFCFFFIFSC